MRKHFIDNLRWMDVFLLIPYHAAQAFNTWGELNYITLSPSKPIASFTVFFSPFFMPLLFLLAGMSTRYALRSRTLPAYILERAKRLLVPFLFGTLVFCPILAYIGDVTNCGYRGDLIGHFPVFFTKWTDLSGFDGGFGVGQFWFLYFLFIISVVSVCIITMANKAGGTGACFEKIPFPLLCLLVLPLPLLYEVLVVGGKSFAEYTYIFLIGYYIMAHDKVIEKVERYRFISLAVGLVASVADVYMFIWSGMDFGVANVIAKALAEWFMILALVGLGKNKLDFSNKVTEYMSGGSFMLFSWHFLWVVLFQWWFTGLFPGNAALLFFVPTVCAYAATMLCVEISRRVPVLCFLMGTKKRR